MKFDRTGQSCVDPCKHSIMAKVLVWLSLLAVGCVALDDLNVPNFYAVDVLPDGELERRFFLDGLAAKETSAIFSFNGTK